jgi:chromosomal replication initiator protein
MAAPDLRLRSAILDEKARALGFALDPAVASRLARELGGDVRRLEGALTRVVACAQLSGRTIDAALVDEVVPVLRRRRPGTITVGRIAVVTAEAFGTSPRALRGRARQRDLAVPRQVVVYVARELLGRSFAALATEFARDQTTLRHAWHATIRRRAQDPALDALVTRVVHQLREEEEGR